MSQLEFVTDPAEREQLLADGKLSCFNGLRLDGFESVNYGIAEASPGVQKILFHIRTILANEDPEVYKRPNMCACPKRVNLCTLSTSAPTLLTGW